MAEVKWIKLKANIFDNRKIRQIRALPEGNTIALMWFFLISLAGQINDNGQIYLTKEIPYNTKTLAIAFEESETVVNMALKVFQDFKMIEIVDDFICLPNWEKYQNVDGLERIKEQNRLRQAKYRENKALEDVETNSNVTNNVTVTQSNAIDIERRKKNKKEDIYKDNDFFKDKSKEFIDLFDDYLEVRKKIKAPNTQRALTGLINKLKPYSEREQMQMLENAIVGGWKSVYPLEKEKSKPKSSNFNNFEQRNTDFEKTENDLLGWIKNGT